MENFWYYILAAAVGIALGLFIAYKIVKGKKFKLDKHKVLKHCFGEPVYAGTFSLGEAKDWIKERENLLKNGCKSVIAKVNNQTLKMLGVELALNFDANPGNYLVVAIIDKDKNEIKDSVLIKYDKLNTVLEDVLAKGDGVLVVEA